MPDLNFPPRISSSIAAPIRRLLAALVFLTALAGAPMAQAQISGREDVEFSDYFDLDTGTICTNCYKGPWPEDEFHFGYNAPSPNPIFVVPEDAQPVAFLDGVPFSDVGSAQAGRVRLSIYDVAGRLIHTLLDVDLPAGSHEAAWDGRDSSGREVASGSYLARLEFGNGSESIRMGLFR